MELDITHD